MNFFLHFHLFILQPANENNKNRRNLTKGYNNNSATTHKYRSSRMLEQKCKIEEKKKISNNYEHLQDTATNLKLTSRVG